MSKTIRYYSKKDKLVKKNTATSAPVSYQTHSARSLYRDLRKPNNAITNTTE